MPAKRSNIDTLTGVVMGEVSVDEALHESNLQLRQKLPVVQAIVLAG